MMSRRRRKRRSSCCAGKVQHEVRFWTSLQRAPSAHIPGDEVSQAGTGVGA